MATYISTNQFKYIASYNKYKPTTASVTYPEIEVRVVVVVESHHGFKFMTGLEQRSQ